MGGRRTKGRKQETEGVGGLAFYKKGCLRSTCSQRYGWLLLGTVKGEMTMGIRGKYRAVRS